MRRAIAKSCDTYFYAMGHRVGYDRIAPMAQRLGLGQKFDLPVVSQSYGTVPDSAWKAAQLQEKPTHDRAAGLDRSDTLNASIGQGFLILNPLQLAVMAARIASGRNVQPRLIGVHKQAGAAARHCRRSISTSSRGACGKWSTATAPPAPAGCRSRASRWAARPAPRRSARSPAASAARAATGRYRDHGLFVFFAPSDNPRYAGAVVIEHGLGGARAAAPVAKDVLTYPVRPATRRWRAGRA